MAQRFGPFIYDRALGRLWHSDGDVHLRPKTFDLLGYLLDHAPGLVSHDDLVDSVWQGRVLSDAVVAQAVSELRRALGDEARRPRFVETVHRRGYRFVHPLESPAPVRAAETPAPSRSGLLAIVAALLVLAVGAAWHLGSRAAESPPLEVLTLSSNAHAAAQPARVAFLPLASKEVAEESGSVDLVALVLAMVQDAFEPAAPDGVGRSLLPVPRHQVAQLIQEHGLPSPGPDLELAAVYLGQASWS